jgi:hypothetical protein
LKIRLKDYPRGAGQRGQDLDIWRDGIINWQVKMKRHIASTEEDRLQVIYTWIYNLLIQNLG